MKIENKTVVEILSELGQRLGFDLLSELESQLNKKKCNPLKLLTESLVIDSIIRHDKSCGIITSYNTAQKEFTNQFSKVESGGWPPFAVLWDVYEKLKTVKGNELVEFVEYTTRTMDQISKADSDTTMAVEMEKNHYLGFGIEDGKAALNEYINLININSNKNIEKESSESQGAPNKLLLKAIKKGIITAGRKNVYVAIALILASLLLWLAMGNTKQVLGIVCNATEEDLYTRNWEDIPERGISDVFMNTGKMTSYMSGYFPPEYDRNLAIPYSYIDEEKIGDSIIWCGGFFMEKKFGFYGTEGLFLLENKAKSLIVAALGACPYSQNNRTWIKGVDKLSDLDTDKAKKDLLQKMYDEDKISQTTVFKNHTLYTQLGSKKKDDKDGGETAIIVSIADNTLISG